jgi:hypothetical protein
VANDRDVVEILERRDLEAVLALVGVLPYLRDAPADAIRCFDVKEVWLGTIGDNAGVVEQTPLFVDERDEIRSGLFGEAQGNGVVLWNLVAKVGLSAPSNLG